jgi:hypothetical protein
MVAPRQVSELLLYIIGFFFRARLIQCFNRVKSHSIGLRSDEYFGENHSLVPAAKTGLSDFFAFMAVEVVHGDGVARPRGGDVDLYDVSLETHSIDRTINQTATPNLLATASQLSRVFGAAIVRSQRSVELVRILRAGFPLRREV